VDATTDLEARVSSTYDAIIVGARCAGAPTAMLLARRGHRVLLVDRASFPTDTLSTHLIHAPGIAALRRWGLADEVIATGCPPIGTYALDFGPVVVRGTPHPAADGGSTAYAPRRTVLDAILVDAAARAGAEVREGFGVDDILVEDGRVVGLRGRDAGGRIVIERARVVVGADGWASRVARAVRPAQYHEKPMLQTSYYTYWSDLPVDGMQTVIRPGRGWAAFPTNDGLTLLVVGWPQAEAAAYKADVEANYLATLGLVPEVAERVRHATRQARFACGSVPNFFRMPYGPGWALVGDAGYTKDPITAQGIGDAFADAERCAAALDAAFAGTTTYRDAMAAYQAARDAHARPIYDFTTELATLEGPPPEVQQLLGAIHGHPAAMDAFVSLVAGTISPAEFFDPEAIGRMLGAPAPT
jgi:2-polyprenyl-6-methoxyphenol hydroxylase-like FAD-dependent oxidoreductase